MVMQAASAIGGLAVVGSERDRASAVIMEKRVDHRISYDCESGVCVMGAEANGSACRL